MATVLDDVLTTSNPATGAQVGRVAITPPDHVGEIVARARGRFEAMGRNVMERAIGCSLSLVEDSQPRSRGLVEPDPR